MEFDLRMLPSCSSVEVDVTVVAFIVVVVSFDLLASHFLQSNFSVLLTLASVVVLVVVDVVVVVLNVVAEVVDAVPVVGGTLSVETRHLS